jgi:hypothetical protein
MSTVSFTATRFEPVFRLPPPPPSLVHNTDPDVLPPVLPIVVPRRRSLRRPKQSLPVMEAAFAGGTLLILALFAMSLVDRIQPHLRVVANHPLQNPRQRVQPADQVAVAQGRGAQGKKGTNTNTTGNGQGGAGGASIGPAASSPQECEEYVAAGIQACREGRFAAADDFGRKATKASPKDHRGQAVRLLAAYLQQYQGLTDEAIDRMNGAVEVDLGRPHGISAFVDRHDDEVVFIANGRHVTFGLREFKALNGVRFQVTRQFLENGRQPANDLILGAIHFVMQLDDNGVYRADGDGSRQAASLRWQAAAGTHDAQVAGHAQALLSLLDDSGRRVAVVRQP